MICRRGRLLAALLALALPVVGCGPQRPPDVVIFVIDTLRADRLGVYGHERPTSPAIDALADDATVFEHAYAPAPWTLPSTVSLLTSTFPCEHGVLVDGQRLAPEVPTLAGRLREAGYATANFHANPYAGAVSGLDRGFEVLELRGQTGAAALRGWLRALDDRPFFLYVHNTEPHDPYAGTSRSAAGAAGEQGADVDPGTRQRVNRLLGALRSLTRADWAEGREPGATDNSAEQRAVMGQLEVLRGAVDRLYDAEVRRADQRLGSVVQLLRLEERWDDTLFVLTSDHGEEFGEHGGWQHDQSVYEELLRVPLVVRWPGGEHAGRRVETPVSLLDVVPTVLEAAGLPAGEVRGRSLRARLEAGGAPAGEGALPSPVGVRVNRKKFYRPFARGRGDVNVALRAGPWKGIWNAEPETLELYHLPSDPGELRDRAAEEPERARRWSEAAAEWLAACRAGTREPGIGPELDEESRERLRALGYLD